VKRGKNENIGKEYKREKKMITAVSESCTQEGEKNYGRKKRDEKCETIG
jgi:hypothetical protein